MKIKRQKRIAKKKTKYGIKSKEQTSLFALKKLLLKEKVEP